MRKPVVRIADIAALADEVARRTALVGAFDPLKLLDKDMDQETKLGVLAALGQVCEETVEDGELRWQLKADERLRILAGLTDKKTARRLAGRTKLDKADRFGRALQNALLGSEQDGPAAASSQDDAYAARTFAIAAPFASKRKLADPQPIRQQIAERDEDRRRSAVLPGKLFGRVAEVAAINQFLGSGSIQENWRLPGVTPGNPDAALLVTGVGGVGKSALISKIVSDAAHNAGQPVLVVIDFDRPNLFRGDRLEIVREISRQISRALPSLDQVMSHFRSSLGEDLSSSDEAASSLGQGHALSAFRNALHHGGKSAIENGRVGIILDTFEEIVIRGEPAVLDILEWLADLRNEGGLTGSRLIVSGRSAPDLTSKAMLEHFSAHISLQGLDEQSGAELLRETASGKKLFHGSRAKDAARALRGHPQALRLLRRYGEQNPDDVDAVIREGLENDSFGAEFAQVFLFTRILGRIRDGTVAKLAHPGLVLRRVTPDLIQHVLAGPCDLGDVSNAQAKTLFDRLAGTAWIVDQLSADVVAHRRDLRRLMLPAMMATDAKRPHAIALRELALKVHEKAADWYSKHKDPILSSENQDLEAFYHLAFLVPATELKEHDILRFASMLGEDLDDLPPRVRGIAKIEMGRIQSLTTQEIQALPAKYQDRVRVSHEEFALKRGQIGMVARSGFSAGSKTRANRPPRSAPETFGQAEEQYGRELNALWAEVDLDGMAEVGQRAFGKLWERGSKEPVIEAKVDPIYLGVWKYLLALLVVGKWPEPLLRSMPTTGLYEWGATSSGYATPLAIHAVAVAFAAHGNVWQRTTEPDVQLRMSQPIASSFNLRCAQAAGTTFEGNVPFRVQCSLLRLLAQPILGSWLPDEKRDERSAMFSVDFDRQKRVPIKLTKLARRAPQRSIEETLGILGPYYLTHRRADDDVSSGLTTRAVMGRLHELHVPIIHCLRPLANDLEAARLLAGIGQAATIWPNELVAKNISASTVRRVDRFVANLIDWADQCGLLIELLDAALKISPRDHRIKRARLLVDRVEAAVHRRQLPMAVRQ